MRALAATPKDRRNRNLVLPIECCAPDDGSLRLDEIDSRDAIAAGTADVPKHRSGLQSPFRRPPERQPKPAIPASVQDQRSRDSDCAHA